MKKKAIFLDKDGTLIEDLPYNVDPSKVIWQYRCFDLLRSLASNNYLLVIVTNQPGVAMGLFGITALKHLENYFRNTFRQQKLHLAGFYYCPHAAQGIITDHAPACKCRKPQPGLLLKAAADLDIDLSASWMIGDILNDVEAGNRCGCRTILVNNGNETEWKWGPLRKPTHIVPTICDAAKHILHEKHLMHTGR